LSATQKLTHYQNYTSQADGTGGPSYREAKGGAFDFFHHKRPVCTITNLELPIVRSG
jgi:hypothetical protein